MRVVVSSSGANLDAPFSHQFGRCPMFVFIETATMEFEATANPAADASGGAGIQAAQFIVDSGVGAVISGSFGPNAMNVFEAAGLPVYRFGGGTVRQAVEALGAEELELFTGGETEVHGTVPESPDGNLGGRRARHRGSSGEDETR
jgi:predicted Fe-Mo cluster-binding NifX family protein